jgi:hypothetical protein
MIFLGAHLQYAILYCAHLEHAMLDYAHLEGAILTGAHLQGAQFNGAHLQGAQLDGTDLTQDQFDSAITDESTLVPPHIKRQAQRREPADQAAEGRHEVTAAPGLGRESTA